MPFINFNTQGLLCRTFDGRNFMFKEKIEYVTESGETLVFDVDETSDGASTPSFIWGICPPFGKHWRAAVVHDLLYRFTKREKKFCDNVFHEIMKADGVSPFESFAMYQAVKDFGEKAFEEDRKK